MKKIIKIMSITLLFIGIFYLLNDMSSSAVEIAQAYTSMYDVTTMSKADFLVGYKETLIKETLAYHKASEINIDKSLFSETAIRLNTEIYDITADVIDSAKAADYPQNANTILGQSFKKLINPIMAIAMTTAETQIWVDTNYTWSSAIYSKPLSNIEGFNWRNLKISQVNSEFYQANNLGEYLACGTQDTAGRCTARTSGKPNHKCTPAPSGKIAKNDNDSLGCLQIRRSKLEDNSGNMIGIYYREDGTFVQDLMCWQDNVTWFYHAHADSFCSKGAWNKDYQVRNEFELMALLAVAHNTGSSFISSRTSIGSASGWSSWEAIFRYCKDLTLPENIRVIEDIVSKWYISTVDAIQNNRSWSLPGNAYSDGANAVQQAELLLSQMDMDIKDYTNERRGHKQRYPLKALINYMALKMLYNSKNL